MDNVDRERVLRMRKMGEEDAADEKLFHKAVNVLPWPFVFSEGGLNCDE